MFVWCPLPQSSGSLSHSPIAVLAARPVVRSRRRPSGQGQPELVLQQAPGPRVGLLRFPGRPSAGDPHRALYPAPGLLVITLIAGPLLIELAFLHCIDDTLVRSPPWPVRGRRGKASRSAVYGENRADQRLLPYRAE